MSRALVPGRECPLSYRYRPEDIASASTLTCDTAYIIGGLYGNPEALDSILAMKLEDEAAGGRVTLVFNGDFNWFNARAGEFRRINEAVLEHPSTQGNVEAELAVDSGAGCGCGYPDDVDAATVDRSNAIMARLRETAAGAPDIQARLAGLPRYLRMELGGIRVGVIHGDPESLAGWGFAVEAMPPAGGGDTAEALIRSWFSRAAVDVFTCSHTCLPVARRFNVAGRCALVMNNGSAGMPNFEGDRRGLITRLSLRPAAAGRVIYGTRLGPVHCDAVPVDFDQDAWESRFLALWPAGSPAHRSYWSRIRRGPAFSVARAREGIARG